MIGYRGAQQRIDTSGEDSTDIGWHVLSNATYLSNTASFVFCDFRRVKDHHKLP